MKNFFSLLFVLFVSFAGAQNSFAQQSPSGAAGDPTHVAIDGPVMVQLSTDANRPRRVVVISNGPSVRREAGARASADAELERKLAELRQQSDAKNATNESRFSSLETQIRILESKGVNPNDPVIIAIRDEMSRIKSSDQSDKDWRWIYGFLIAIAIMLAILALVLRGGSTVTQTVTINGKAKERARRS